MVRRVRGRLQPGSDRHLAERFELVLDRPAHELSQGNRQKADPVFAGVRVVRAALAVTDFHGAYPH